MNSFIFDLQDDMIKRLSKLLANYLTNAVNVNDNSILVANVENPF